MVWIVLISVIQNATGNYTISKSQVKTVAPAVAGVDASSAVASVSAAATFPVHALVEIVAELQAHVPNLARVLYDLTPKPPGTTEWE